MHRTEFRKTIGEQANQKFMAATQAKLQECINAGENAFSSIQKLSDQIYGSAEMDTEQKEVKSEVKIPFKSKSAIAKESGLRKAYRKKKVINEIAGTDAARLARRTYIKAKRRGQINKKASERKERAPRKNRAITAK